MKKTPWAWIGLILLALCVGWWLGHRGAGQTAASPAPRVEQARSPVRTPSALPEVSASSAGLPNWLPNEAVSVVERIQRGDTFSHRQDGSVFGNRERLLPQRPRGYYREYTVRTPGASNRGARRIITGGQPVEVWYYSDDHYRSFREFEVR